ncbi:MAG: tetratricopeptide repeat protein [Bacteroidia bacterium]|nr:tetratricopeptide repeat protein [Bacteroidia bacterium]
MKRIFFTLIAFVAYSNVFCQTETCATIVKPVFSATAKQEMDQKLAEAKSAYEGNAKDAEAIIWFGRRTAYPGNYEDAIAIFSKGIELHPADARFYRHRGHRYITVRCFDKAISDLKRAAALFKGKTDEAEPDGMPNAQNIPTSTLQSNTWYHLGLAYYLKGDFRNAEKAYRACVKVSANPDMYVATANWLHLTLRQLKKIRKQRRYCEPYSRI